MAFKRGRYHGAVPLRVAAISFLNPAPLLYDFEHEPTATELRTRYAVHYTLPSRCAAELQTGEADLGLIPIAELRPALAVVPGCVIASLGEVRSIVLLVRRRGDQTRTEALQAIRTIAADSASRSSAAYVRVLLERFYSVRPSLQEHVADPLTMLAGHDAALLIGDHALLARERRPAVDAAVGNGAVEKATGESLLWIDIAQMWRGHTGLPWVAAVWAVRPEALAAAGVSAAQLVEDVTRSRDHGLARREEIVAEWAQRLPVSAETIRTYLTRNIHYLLDEPCLEAIVRFRAYAAELGILPELPTLSILANPFGG